MFVNMVSSLKCEKFLQCKLRMVKVLFINLAPALKMEQIFAHQKAFKIPYFSKYGLGVNYFQMASHQAFI